MPMYRKAYIPPINTWQKISEYIPEKSERNLVNESQDH
jgi:hypothetical protein